MLSEPIVITVNAVDRSYVRVTTPDSAASKFRVKPSPSGLDDPCLEIKGQKVGNDGMERRLIRLFETSEATADTPARPRKINVTIECHEDDVTNIVYMFEGLSAKLLAASGDMLSSIVFGEK
jgi:hypothetical protein